MCYVRSWRSVNNDQDPCSHGAYGLVGEAGKNQMIIRVKATLALCKCYDRSAMVPGMQRQDERI